MAKLIEQKNKILEERYEFEIQKEYNKELDEIKRAKEELAYHSSFFICYHTSHDFLIHTSYEKEMYEEGRKPKNKMDTSK